MSAKIVDTKLNLALIFTLSVLPDFDLLFPNLLVHRGATHSLFFSLLIFLPFFLIYRKKAFPYFIVLLSHPLIGDIYSNVDGIQLLWPFSTDWLAISRISNISALSVGFELALFFVSSIIMVYNNEFQKSFFDNSRIYWLIPLGSVLGPLLIGSINSLYYLPFLLVIPSLFYLAIFSIPVLGLNNKKEIILKKKY